MKTAVKTTALGWVVGIVPMRDDDEELQYLVVYFDGELRSKGYERFDTLEEAKRQVAAWHRCHKKLAKSPSGEKGA